MPHDQYRAAVAATAAYSRLRGDVSTSYLLYTYGGAFSPKRSEVGSQEDLSVLHRECTGIFNDLSQKGLDASSKRLATEAGSDDRMQV